MFTEFPQDFPRDFLATKLGDLEISQSGKDRKLS